MNVVTCITLLACVCAAYATPIFLPEVKLDPIKSSLFDLDTSESYHGGYGHGHHDYHDHHDHHDYHDHGYHGHGYHDHDHGYGGHRYHDHDHYGHGYGHGYGQGYGHGYGNGYGLNGYGVSIGFGR